MLMTLIGWTSLWSQDDEGAHRWKRRATVASEKRVGKSLQRVAPEYHQRRQNDSAQRTNPIPYIANNYEHKLHIDQNKKLVMYGVTHVCAIDGSSKYIPGFHTMSVKNNLIICENLYWFNCPFDCYTHTCIACNLLH